MTTGAQAYPGVAVGTLVTRAFMPFARVLAASLGSAHPDVPLVVGITDPVEAPGQHDGLDVMPIDTLGIPDYRRFRFRYDAATATVAAKPFLLIHLLDRGFKRAAFLDSDTLVTGSLGPLLLPEAGSAITITPHRVGPLPDAGEAAMVRDLALMQAGTFNGGCLAVSAHPEARRFLEWWGERLRLHCRHDRHAGMHFDQRWLDLVPAMFDAVDIQRDPGLNVAYWNLPERDVRPEGGTWRAGAGPCRLVHFSGFDPLRPHAASRHAPGLSVDDLGHAAALFSEYATRVREAGYRGSTAPASPFDTFDNGVPIPAVVRGLYLDLGDAVDTMGDPFATASDDSFFNWLREPAGPVAPGAPPVSRLWAHLHRRRADLPLAFPDPFGADREAFLHWTRESGLREHGLSENWL